MSYNADSRGYQRPYPDVSDDWLTHYGIHMPAPQHAPHEIVSPEDPAMPPASSNVHADIVFSSPVASDNLLGWDDLLAIMPPMQDAGVPHGGFAAPPSANDPAYLLALATVTDYAAPILASAGPVTTVSQPIASTSEDAHKTCPHCGNIHRRKGRYEACRNKHLSLRPFACAGKCGKRSCIRTFASSERKMSHIRGRVTCENCGKVGWKQNQSRHRAICNPSGSD